MFYRQMVRKKQWSVFKISPAAYIPSGERWGEGWIRRLEWTYIHYYIQNKGCPWWLSGKEIACQCRRHGFNPWYRKIPHATERLNPCATSIELCCRVGEPQLLKPMHPRARASQQEKPLQWPACALQLESSPCSPQPEKAQTATRESLCSHEDPAQP